MRGIIDTAFVATLDVLAANRDVLERCARELLKVETFDEATLKSLTHDLQRPGGTTPAAA